MQLSIAASNLRIDVGHEVALDGLTVRLSSTVGVHELKTPQRDRRPSAKPSMGLTQKDKGKTHPEMDSASWLGPRASRRVVPSSGG